MRHCGCRTPIFGCSASRRASSDAGWGWRWPSTTTWTSRAATPPRPRAGSRHGRSEPGTQQEKGAHHRWAPFLAIELVVVEVTQQAQDLDVQPDQGDGQAEGDTPGRLLRRTGTDHLVGRV